MCCTRSVQVCCRTTAARWHASRRERQRVIAVPNGNLDKAISTESVLPRTIAKQRNGSKGCQPGPYWSTECSQPAVLQRPGCSKGLYSGIHVGQYRRGIIGKSERRIERNGVCDDRTPAACCPTADIKLVDSR